jgi:hypothetical protein
VIPRLTEIYDVDVDTAWRDAGAFALELEAAGLLERAPVSSTPDNEPAPGKTEDTSSGRSS